ncbi:hypothetical protein K445DRAFT_323700 [Daldinia sp. EC12]|nr:hypothetical protein K445DRAFT_323700 [Daldinia sp. EC12]
MASLDKLPTEILQAIAGYLTNNTESGKVILSQADLASLALVNSRLYSVFDPILWKASIECPLPIERYNWESPVHWAVFRRRIDILEKAFKYHLDLGTARTGSPLHCAARWGHDDVVSWLLDHGVPVNPAVSQEHHGTRYIVPFIHSPLYAAIQARKDATALLLLSRGAHVWFRAETAPEDEFRQAAIHAAAYHGLVGTVKYLVMKMGINVDEFDRELETPLNYAMRRPDNAVVIETLLALGAATKTEQSPQLPLTTAIVWGNFTNAMTLLKAGTEVNISRNGPGIISPLVACALYIQGNIRMSNNEAMLSEQKWLFQKIISCRADVDAPCNGLDTPLGIAVRRGSATSVYELIRGGADVEKCSGDDQLRPIDLIWDLENPTEIAIKGAMLVAAGARLDVLTTGESRTSLENAILYLDTQDSAIPLNALLCAADQRSFHDRYLDKLFQTCLVRRLHGPAKILMNYGASSRGAKEAAYNWANEIVCGRIPDHSHHELLFCLSFQFSDDQIESLFESALYSKDEERCHLLLDRGVLSLSKEPKQWLHIAAGFGSYSLTRRLCRSGMDINALNDDFETPMMTALRASYSTIADLLFDLGADPFHPRPDARCRRSNSFHTEIISPFEYAVRYFEHEYAEKWWLDSQPESLPTEDLPIPRVLFQGDLCADFIEKLRSSTETSPEDTMTSLSLSPANTNNAEFVRFHMKILGIRRRIARGVGGDIMDHDWGMGT